MKIISKVLSAAVLLGTVLFAAESHAATKTFYCMLASRAGVPVLQVEVEGATIIQISELFLSSLTGSIDAEKKLTPIPSSSAGVFRFDLGYRDTEDYSIAVDASTTPIKASFETYDRDSAGGTSEALVCTSY